MAAATQQVKASSELCSDKVSGWKTSLEVPPSFPVIIQSQRKQRLSATVQWLLFENKARVKGEALLIINWN